MTTPPDFRPPAAKHSAKVAALLTEANHCRDMAAIKRREADGLDARADRLNAEAEIAENRAAAADEQRSGR